MMLNDITLARIGLDSSTISPDVIGRPSITPTDTGFGSLFNMIFCIKENSRSMKQEMAPESKRAKALIR